MLHHALLSAAHLSQPWKLGLPCGGIQSCHGLLQAGGGGLHSLLHDARGRLGPRVSCACTPLQLEDPRILPL